MVSAEDLSALEESGWDADAVYEMTALVGFFNFSARMEAASDLPPDEIPEGARFAEATGR